jgi:hypothetical protein
MHAKSPLPVIFFLNPDALPDVIGQRMRDKAAVLPRIGTVPLLIKSQGDDGTILIVPLTG